MQRHTRQMQSKEGRKEGRRHMKWHMDTPGKMPCLVRPLMSDSDGRCLPAWQENSPATTGRRRTPFLRPYGSRCCQYKPLSPRACCQPCVCLLYVEKKAGSLNPVNHIYGNRQRQSGRSICLSLAYTHIHSVYVVVLSLARMMFPGHRLPDTNH
jgi:hypothetical protein